MVQAHVRRIGMREIAVVTAIFAVGWTVRWWHLGTPSLWWDELVHVSFALAPDPWSVFRSVRAGIPAGSGNAGAVPLDYVLLNVWTWLVGRPSVDQLEVYYRFPSYVWSCATLFAFWAYCRAAFGRVVAITATALLALSIPHVLYAVEARFYSLLMLMSVLNLATFTWVMRRPELPRAWIAYAFVSLLFFFTGLLSLLVLPWQYGALALGTLRGGGGRTWVRRLGLLVLTATCLGGALALYYAEMDLGARGIRPGAGLLRGSHLVRDALAFMTLGDPRELALYAWGALIAPWYCLRRRRDMLPVVVTLLVVEVVSIPLLVQLLQWKRYYFHPRHVLFLLPGLELLAALGLCGTIAGIVSWIPALGRRGLERRVVGAVAVVLVLVLRLPGIRDFMARPHQYFARSKTDRDMRGLVRDLRSRTAFYRPGEKYLLIVDRIGPGNLATPTLARYLQWYSLDKRIVLLATMDMSAVIEQLQNGCGGPCRGRPGEEVAKALLLLPPFEASAAKLRLLGLKSTFGTWPGVVRDAGVLVYGGTNRHPDFAASDVWTYLGMVVAEPR
jgi:hypothetical protein